MNMVTGVPLTCSRDCAAEFLPFYRACKGKVQFGADDDAFSGFDDTCRASWVASGAQAGAGLAGCNIAALAKSCPSDNMELGMKYDNLGDLCGSTCAQAVSGTFASCQNNPATYSEVQLYSPLHQQCGTYQCIATADAMDATIKQLCCSSGKDCQTPDACNRACANTFVPWYDQCATTLNQATKPMAALYKKCTVVLGVPIDCPSQMNDALLGVRTATESSKQEGIRYNQMVKSLNHAIELSTQRQTTAGQVKGQALNQSNAANLALNVAQGEYTSSVGQYQDALVYCYQPANLQKTECTVPITDPRSRAGPMQTVMNAKNVSLFHAKAVLSNATAALAIATSKATSANTDVIVQQRLQETQLDKEALAVTRFRASKSRADNTLNKVEKLCTPTAAAGPSGPPPGSQNRRLTDTSAHTHSSF